LLESNGRIVAKVAPIVSKENLQRIMVDTVCPKATMVSDAFRVYNGLGKRFKHIIINHSDGIYVENGFTTNGIENYWSVLKRGIYGIYHSVSRKHLQRYCDEFSFRYNSKHITDDERFENSVKNSQGRLKYKHLIR
jgi:transposase-like protein